MYTWDGEVQSPTLFHPSFAEHQCIPDQWRPKEPTLGLTDYLTQWCELPLADCHDPIQADIPIKSFTASPDLQSFMLPCYSWELEKDYIT